MITHYAISARQLVSQSEKIVIVFDAGIRCSYVYQLGPGLEATYAIYNPRVKVELCFLL